MYLNDKYYKVGFKTLWHRAPNMDSLIAVGSIAAVIYGVFAIYQMGYGLGHGDMERVARYHHGPVFRVCWNDPDPDYPGEIFGDPL